MGKLGMWVFLAGDAMGFGALIAGYGALRYYSTNWPHPSVVLGIGLTALMTFILTGFHGMHVTGGVIYLTSLLLRSLGGAYSANYAHPVEIAGLYWHFVDLVWILIFTFVYLL
jgi:heme/copper-type cytochrome/quinol oxidase subunit 3